MDIYVAQLIEKRDREHRRIQKKFHKFWKQKAIKK